jgi:FOG: Ankyrin repeat
MAQTNVNSRELFAAIDKGDYGTFEALLERGANVNGREADTGRTPLIAALEAKRAVFVRTLLEKGARVETRDAGGRTPLHAAVEQDDVALARLLLSHRAIPDAADDAGLTPLMEAAAAGSDRMVGALLTGRPTLNRRDHAGMTALMLAVTAPEEGAATVLRLLAKAGADVNAARTGDGMTALMLAARAGRTDSARALLALGADPKRTARNNQTALRLARARRSPELIALLDGARR